MTDGLSEAYETKKWDAFCENNDLRLENAKLREHGERLFDKTLELGTENDRLRDTLKALVVGTNAEFSTDEYITRLAHLMGVDD